MHNERTLRHLDASIEVEHERDLFAEGYWAAVKKCDELDASTHDQAKQSQLKQED